LIVGNDVELLRFPSELSRKSTSNSSDIARSRPAFPCSSSFAISDELLSLAGRVTLVTNWRSGPKVTLPFEDDDEERSLFLRIPRLGTTGCFSMLMIGISSLEKPLSNEDLGESEACGFVSDIRGQKEPLLKGHLRLVLVRLMEAPGVGLL
jgi:hypothetical protein